MKFERFLTQKDALTLDNLAESLIRSHDAKFDFADKLIELISTAVLLPENSRRTDCVALHSRVFYRTIGTDERHSIVIVCPQEADSAAGKISILAPLGMALLGHARHSIVDFSLPSREVRFIEILDIEHPTADCEEIRSTAAAVSTAMPNL